MKFKDKVGNTVKGREDRKLKRQDSYSATEFMKGLSKGNLEVGSLLFSGDDREVKIIKKICRYLGFNYTKREVVKCTHIEAANTFNVIHYTVAL